MKVCNVRSCDKFITPKSAKGLCPVHYKRLLKGKDLEVNTNYDVRPAIIEGNIARIPIGIDASDGYALVDEEFAFVSEVKWHITNKKDPARGSYVSSTKNENGRVVETKLHQLIIGKPPKGYIVDHKNRNRLDNRLDNLRFIKQQENTFNHSKYKNNTSGYIGVYLRKQNNRWMAKIGYNGKLIALGDYATPEEAAKVRDAKAIELHGEFAVLNF